MIHMLYSFQSGSGAGQRTRERKTLIELSSQSEHERAFPFMESLISQAGFRMLHTEILHSHNSNSVSLPLTLSLRIRAQFVTIQIPSPCMLYSAKLNYILLMVSLIIGSILSTTNTMGLTLQSISLLKSHHKSKTSFDFIPFNCVFPWPR